MSRALLLGLLAGCSSAPTLSREVLDCSGEESLCEAQVAHTGCSLGLGAPTADGGVEGGCADAGARRACTRQCETGSDCPAGWTCSPASACPGTASVQYCVPTDAELEAQGRRGCHSVADPRVCGFF